MLDSRLLHELREDRDNLVLAFLHTLNPVDLPVLGIIEAILEAEEKTLATLLEPSGKETQIAPKDAARGFTLQELYSLIHCTTVQEIELADGRSMWMDEEGKFRSILEINHKATRLLELAGGDPGDFVVGIVLITPPNEVG